MAMAWGCPSMKHSTSAERGVLSSPGHGHSKSGTWSVCDGTDELVFHSDKVTAKPCHEVVLIVSRNVRVELLNLLRHRGNDLETIWVHPRTRRAQGSTSSAS